MTDLLPVLAPPETKPLASVARVADAWYVACTSKALGRKPLKRTVLGIPMVLFRTQSGTPGALLDRCPHRNIPLSMGCVVGEHIQCAYHGWKLDTGGICRHIPGLAEPPEGKARRTPAFPVRDQDGYIWVWGTPDSEPTAEPFALPDFRSEGYTVVRRRVVFEGTLHATMENALDVPHTAFLHAGLFRGSGEPNDIEVVVRRHPDHAEAEYIGEPRPEGLAARILSPSGGTVVHFDRFFLPSVAQVDYRIGTENHFLVTALGTPETDFRTVVHAVVAFKMRLPGWLLKPIIYPFAMKVFQQDAVILRAQTEAIARFGGEQFASSDVDILGGPIWRLLKAAERGELDAPGTDPVEKRLTIRV
ncbi:MAG: aromatic ring-hydroxylating dioxygenase subunit alpha [Myxococcota bacterium]|nr:aromatic ring-hydroxylating dioxygenase subunit alpha [Myxococcota bacterium]